ncbi:MAG: hypothetical protein MJZ31_13085 [Bacteroidales bacterium]|nr:hypothetical protein [Bacteroidales bacterium]
MRSSLLFLLSITLVLFSCKKETEHNLLDIYIAWNDMDMQIGEEAQLDIRLYPDNASLGLPTSKPVWTSSDTTVVYIDANGRIKALNYGRSLITVQWGNFKAQKYVVVNAEVILADDKLQALLIKKFDANQDGKLHGTEIESAVGLDLSDLSYVTYPISFKGLEVFTKLTNLKISDVRIGEIDFSAFRHLERLDISQSDIKRVDIHDCPKLRWIDCHACGSLTDLYIGDYDNYGPCKLETIDCARCSLSSLDLSRCELLEYLEYSDNFFEQVDLSACPKLKVVNGINVARPYEEPDSLAE